MDVKKPTTDTLEALRGLKRRVYSWALAVGLAAVLAGWVFKGFAGTSTPFDQLIFPILAVFLAGLFIALRRSVRLLGLVEALLFAGTALSLLGALAAILFTPETSLDPDHLAAFSDLFYWFPLVYLLAFLIFENRRRMLAGSLIFFAAALSIGLVHSLLEWNSNGDMDDIYTLGRFFLANVAYIVLLMVSLRVNESYMHLRTVAAGMTHLATTDSLTQIANRRELETTLAREASRAVRYKHPISAILFDLDEFKQVNDTFGHAAGDAVLKETARVVNGFLRLPDVLGRWGGEEFMLVAPHADAAGAGRLAERLRRAVSEIRLERVGTVTASFGVAQLRPQESVENWIKRADEAMFAAKKGGRNLVVTL